MPAHEVDISWHVLRRIVQEWAGESAELAEVKPLEGGMINTTLALTTAAGERCVLKVSPHRVDKSHEYEAYQLNLLRDLGLPVPKVYAWSLGTLDAPFSYILIEFLDGVNLGAAKQQCPSDEFERLQDQLAEIVLKLHTRTSDHYQRVMDGGKTFGRWSDFFRDLYGNILHEAEKSQYITVKVRKQLDKVHERLDTLLAHEDRPRLLHGDLWNTNILAAPNGNGHWRISGLLDPGCKYGDSECELAYLELFHTCTPAFMKTYQQERKLSADYHRVRKPIYHLYELANHVQLFGQEYVKPMMSALEKVMPLV